jgi:ribosome maturation protein Sdo1
MGSLMELYMWNRRPFMTASEMEMVSHVTRRAVNPLAGDPHWQIIEKYWNTAMQQNNIWSTESEAGTKEILKEEC